MVSGSRIEGGTILSAPVRKTILSIKEIVKNHSEAEIYTTLKESNMDPNETAQKLLNQDPFHEVKRKRDKRKESMVLKAFAEPRKHMEHVGEGMKFNTNSDHNARRGGYTRISVPHIGREFRVVRDNRVNQNMNRESKPAFHPTSMREQGVSNVVEKSSTGMSSGGNPSSGYYSSQADKRPTDSQPRLVSDDNSSVNDKEMLERQAVVQNSVSHVQAVKLNNSQPNSSTTASASNNSVLGVYSSSSDPVHVPSPDSRSSASVRAIKREVGVVGGRRLSSDNPIKTLNAPSGSASSSLVGRDVSSHVEPHQPYNSISKRDQLTQSNVPEYAGTNMSLGRSFLSSQYNRPHQQTVGHQKAPQPSKEWKPKSSQKSVSGEMKVSEKSFIPSANQSKDMTIDEAQLQDKISQVNIAENQNVVIAQHIRVSETDRCQLTFGSFGSEVDSSNKNASGVAEVSTGQASASLSVSASESVVEDTSGSKQVDVLPDQVRYSASDSPVSTAVHEPQLSDKRDTLSPRDLDSYADIGLVQESSPSYTPDSQQQQDRVELQSFAAYDPQTGYDIPYFRPALDETVCRQDVPSPQESLNSHAANSIPASTISMVQQQQPPVAQMYPQVHVPHFANIMPYRQFLSPVYVPPPMAMPGYSSNPPYPHPSNGSSYLLMPGGNSPHLSANGVKYGIQQFKPIPAGSPTGFGNFTGLTGYAISAPGVVGNPTGLEDSSRLKYKDGNHLYVPNPQAETSEIWIQNPRDLSGLQSAPYYNVPGQTPHAAYVPSHTGQASFNAAAAQSSHMQFAGLYNPSPQPTAIANPHHLGPAMGGNVGLGVAAAAPGSQVGAYQQPQLGHLNWQANF